MLRDTGRTLDAALGPGGIFVLLAILVIATIRRRDISWWVPWAGGLAAVLGLVALVSAARLQPYYICAVVPLFLYGVGLCDVALEGRFRRAATAVLVSAAVVPLGLALGSGSRAYVRPPDAFMPEFVDTIAARDERVIATVASFDATLLTYYLARRYGGPVDWPGVQSDGSSEVPRSGRRIIHLAQAHLLRDATGQEARQRLEAWLRQGPVLVLDRHSFRLPAIDEALARCTEVAEAPTARLLACRATPASQAAPPASD